MWALVLTPSVARSDNCLLALLEGTRVSNDVARLVVDLRLQYVTEDLTPRASAPLLHQHTHMNIASILLRPFQVIYTPVKIWLHKQPSRQL